MKTQTNQNVLNPTERISIADNFIRKHKLSDDDICQDIYLAALENPSLEVVDLRDLFTNIVAEYAQNASSQMELPKGLLIGIVRNTDRSFNDLIRKNDYAGILELLSVFM